MGDDVTSDVEVTMGTSGKERQRKYIEKQRLEGKRPVTVLLSQMTKDVLELERKMTGESLSSIIERAVMNIKTPVTIDKPLPQKTTEYATRDKSKKEKKPPKQNNLELF
jgi:hypothetical protein